MEKTLSIIQIAISVLLMISILLQNRGAGLSAAFGGDMSGFYTKRGIEKFLFFTTIILGGLFIINAIATLIVSSRA